jgi:predicted DNA-binding protein (MmcQ/YjbR family)
VTLGGDAPDQLVRDLIEDSYDLVRPRRKETR